MGKAIKKAAILFAAISVIFAFAAPVWAAQSEQALLKAANSGKKDAMYELAFLYFGQRDVLKAEQWFKKAAEAGHVDAMYALSKIASNKEFAAKWREKAAKKGHFGAMHDMAFESVADKDGKKAVKWLKKAAKAGDDSALEDLFKLYWSKSLYGYNVKGVSKDYDEAIEWVEKMKKKDKAYYAYQIGKFYYYGEKKFFGRDIKPNLKKAKKWLNIALEGSQREDAEALLKEIAIKELEK